MIEVRASIEVEASATTVWRVLTDLASYHEWNPFIRDASGSLEVGGKVSVRVRPPMGIHQLAFQATVLSRDEERELHWRGSLGGSWLASGEHWFRIEPLDEHRVRFLQVERFEGLLSSIARRLLEPQARIGFEAMNAKLAARAEKLERIATTMHAKDVAS